MMAKMRFLVLGLLGVLGCSSSSFDVGSADVGGVDSTTLDTARDSNAGDSAASDSAASDSATSDSATGDSAAGDTAADSAGDTKADLGSDTPTDSSPPDSPALDAPADAPSDGTCVRPPSTSTFPTDGLGCSELLAKYPAYFDDARTCTCDDDCNQKIDRGFCGCEAWVSEGNDAYPALVAMQERWKKLSCSVPCPKVLCPGAGTAKCEKLTGGPLGKCRVGPG